MPLLYVLLTLQGAYFARVCMGGEGRGRGGVVAWLYTCVRAWGCV